MVPLTTRRVLLLPALLACTSTLSAADLVLARDKKTEYEIVLPDASPSPAIAEALQQAGRLMHTAFQANGIELPVVAEGKHDPAHPGIFLGDTTFARVQKIDPAKFERWGYVQRTVGRNVIIAGHDQPAPTHGENANARRPDFDRVGTAKGVVDFLRQYVGTRFLYPDLRSGSALKDSGQTNLLTTPALEFLPTPTVAVPADLDVQKTPVLEFNTAYPGGASFYDVALNRFPLIDTAFGTHTYDRAVPLDKYYATHPEYFALQRTPGKGQKTTSRLKDTQYCISNAQVQELVYQDLLAQLDRGFTTVDIGQPDGFRPCQCEDCAKLYNTGDDWSEKLWLFHRQLAERVLAARPGKEVMMLSYILTAAPPKTFTKFPSNTRIMWCGTNESDIARWSGCEVPGGFTSYLYNWCPNLTGRYTPMRTPLFVEEQVKRLVKYRVQGVKRDGPGQLFGLEGPTYYVMGRMFDDAEHLRAADLVTEYCEAAFGEKSAARPMQRFYDLLYHGIELYSDQLGTRAPAWHYVDIYGKKHKSLSDPFQLLGFLYTPKLLNDLEAELGQAERAANTDKIKTRLTLVRREFEYLKALARVVHLTHAYEIVPDLSSRDRLLDAIDTRNALIGSYYGKRNSQLPMSGWDFTLFPFSGGHTPEHLRLAHDGYQEPFANTSLNWDTKAMRAAPLPGAKRISVASATGALALDAPAWNKAPAFDLGSPATTARALFDRDALYLRVESQLAPEQKGFTTAPGEPDLRQAESLDVYLAPIPGRELYYRFMVAPAAGAKWDAASGLIADAMDPRHARDNPDWNGEWTYDSRVDSTTHRWTAFLRIPFKTLGVETPASGAFWRGNFGRVHPTAPGQLERAVWSSTAGRPSMDDRSAFGEIVFK